LDIRSRQRRKVDNFRIADNAGVIDCCPMLDARMPLALRQQRSPVGDNIEVPVACRGLFEMFVD
jgi:hypothetical protein